MADQNTSVLRRGFALVIRHQRILWWVFAVNLIMGGLGASGTARAAADALHHSLAGERLVDRFDIGIFAELVQQPSVQLSSHSHGIFIFAAFYFLFLLFVTPGIVSVYLEDRRFATGEFLGAAGEFFWPFVRLSLWSLIPLSVLNLLYEAIKALSDYTGKHATADQAGFLVLVIGCIPVLLLCVFVRLWFDLAQARTVAINDRTTLRSARRMFPPALGHAGRLYGIYTLLGALAWMVTGVALLIWTRAPGRAIWLTFLLLEIIMLVQIFGRLWLKACATAWYTLNPEPVAVTPEPLPYLPPEAVTVPAIDAPLSPEVGPVPEPRPVESPTDQKNEI